MNIEELRNLRKLLNREYYVINASNPNEPLEMGREKMNFVQLQCERYDTIEFARSGVKLLEQVLTSRPQSEKMQFQIHFGFLATEPLTPFGVNNMQFIDDIILADFHVHVPQEVGSKDWDAYSLSDFDKSVTQGYRPVHYRTLIEELIKQGYDFNLPLELSEYTRLFVDTCKTAPVIDAKVANAVRRARGEAVTSDFIFKFNSVDLSPFAPVKTIDLVDEKESVK